MKNYEQFRYELLDKGTAWKLSNIILEALSKESGLTCGQVKEALSFTSSRMEDMRFQFNK